MIKWLEGLLLAQNLHSPRTRGSNVAPSVVVDVVPESVLFLCIFF